MSSNFRKVLIAAPVHHILIDGLVAAGYVCEIQERITQESAFTLVADCVGIITSTRLQLDKSLIDAAPQLEWIGRMGSGMEVIDLQYATSKGIKCYGSPEGNCNAVGEHALGMLLSLARRIVTGHNEISNGIWRRDENRGIELEGKTLAIIGFGHTGRSFAQKLSGFNMHLMAYDKYNKEGFPPEVENCEDMGSVFEKADIVSFHVPLQTDTHHYFNSDFVASMKKPFILINTSRGRVVDTGALYQGVKANKITGACIDVFEYEPVTKMGGENGGQFRELLSLPQIVFTPHIAGYTFEALFKMSQVLLNKIVY